MLIMSRPSKNRLSISKLEAILDLLAEKNDWLQ